MEIVSTFPLTRGGHTDMSAHYAAFHHAAKAIAEQIITVRDRERVAREPQ
jgi:hypothetical protein